MAARFPCSLAPDDLARMKARLSEMVEEFLRESDPKHWADSSTPESQKRRYFEKRQAEVTLKQMTALSQMIAAVEGARVQTSTPESKATTATVKDARAKAKALREAAGIEGAPD